MLFVRTAWLQQRRAIGGVFNVDRCGFIVGRQLVIAAQLVSQDCCQVGFFIIRARHFVLVNFFTRRTLFFGGLVVVVIKVQTIVVGPDFVSRCITYSRCIAVNGDIDGNNIVCIIICNVKCVWVDFFALGKFVWVNLKPGQGLGVATITVDVRLWGVIVVNHYRARTLAEVWLKRAHYR